MTEAELLEHVTAAAAAVGVLTYHVKDSRRAPSGFPDLVLAGPAGVAVAELKSAAGQLTPKQRDWLQALGVGQAVRTYVWYPCDWHSGVIRRELRRLAGLPARLS